MDKKTNVSNGKEKVDIDPSNQHKIWNDSEVKLLKKWAELSASYRVLHDRAHRIFKFRNQCFTIPVIILSTILGTASFSQSTFPVAYQPYIPMGIGSLNIIAGIITTIAQFTRVGELSESNRVASISFGKFSRNIATELSLPPDFRTYSGIDFVQMCRSDFDRLLEQSPIIPLDILEKFMNELEDGIEKPDIMTVSRIEEWKPTKEEKAAKIIASAFQKMHNRGQEKSGVQKMAEMVQKKGYEQVSRLSSMVTPPSVKEIHGLAPGAFTSIQEKVSGDIEKGFEDKKKVFTGFVAKQVESRKEELKKITGTGLVAEMKAKKDEQVKEMHGPSGLVPGAFSSMQEKSSPLKNVKSNVLNIIHKAKQNIQSAQDTYDSVSTQMEEVEEKIISDMENGETKSETSD